MGKDSTATSARVAVVEGDNAGRTRRQKTNRGDTEVRAEKKADGKKLMSRVAGICTTQQYGSGGASTSLALRSGSVLPVSRRTISQPGSAV
jgi:hypothetical protein